MAIDTAAKRKSAVHVGSPWRGCLPFSDGTIDQGDRQTVAFMYSGILAGGAETGTPQIVFTARPRGQTWTPSARGQTWTPKTGGR